MSDPAASALDRSSIMRPIEGAAAVTPHDTNELTNHTRAVWVGVSGSLSVVTTGGDSVTLSGVVAGVWHPIRLKIIKSTGTTATGIVAGY